MATCHGGFLKLSDGYLPWRVPKAQRCSSNFIIIWCPGVQLTSTMRLYCGVVSLSSALVVEITPPDLISNELSTFVEGSKE